MIHTVITLLHLWVIGSVGWLIWAICTHYRHIDEYYYHRDGIFTNIFCWPVLSVIFLVMILYIEAQAFMSWCGQRNS